MTRRRVILVVGACLVLGALAVALWPGEREPGYQGKKLSEWLGEGYGNGDIITDAPPPDFYIAIRQIGTNALPCLLSWVAYERPWWRDRAIHVYEKLSVSVRRNSVESWLDGRGAERKVGLAIRGFGELGPSAAPAVPALVRLLKDSRTDERRVSVMSCLYSIGPAARPALPYLWELSADPSSSMSSDALMIMDKIEPGSVTNFAASRRGNAVRR